MRSTIEFTSESKKALAPPKGEYGDEGEYTMMDSSALEYTIINGKKKKKKKKKKKGGLNRQGTNESSNSRNHEKKM